MNNARMIFVHAVSPLHAGTGQGVGVIDLPIAREKATGLPYLPGSSLKGTLRASCPDDEPQRQRTKVFGKESNDISDADNSASATQFSDQRLLFLPLRSLTGTFAWVTCPYVLHRFLRDVRDIENGQNAHATFSVPSFGKDDTGHCYTAIEKSAIEADQKTVYLEDLDLIAEKNDEIAQWASWIAKQVFPREAKWQSMFMERVCVVHDDVFNFLINTATEITARIKLIPDSKTVQDGGLWYEEALPTETILAGIVLANPQNISVKETFSVLSGLVNKTVQLGGKATVGRGMCRVHMTEEEGK